jgi:cyanate permease
LAFYVDAAVASGVSQQRAGAYFALASIVSVMTRLIAGIVLDRTDVVPLRLAGILVGVGTGGFLLLATGQTTLMTIGVVFALGFTWGFPSSFWIGLMRVFADQPGRITGAMQPAGFGAMAAPLVFGVIVESRGYAWGWLFIFAISIIATGLFLWSSFRLASQRGY